MTEFFPICFSTLFLSSCEQAAHQRHSTNPRFALHDGVLGTTPSIYSMAPERVNVNAMNRIPMMLRQEIIFIRLLPWEHSPSSILFITFSSLPFNLCHQSEWQAVWSSSQAWWEKERCQHKYPSWSQRTWSIHSATMNLYRITGRQTLSPLAWLQNATLTPSLHFPKKTWLILSV